MSKITVEQTHSPNKINTTDHALLHGGQIDLQNKEFKEFCSKWFGLLIVDPEKQRQIAENALQRGPDWHDIRGRRITSSNYGPMAGHSKYQSPDSAVNDRFHGSTSFSSPATEWGELYENVARYKTLQFLDQCNFNGKPEEALKQLNIWSQLNSGPCVIQTGVLSQAKALLQTGTVASN